MISARLTLNEYTNRVLNVVKAKFGLKDKSEALNRFVEIYGDEEVGMEAKDDYLKKVLEIDQRHMKKYANRKMTLKELDQLCEVS